MAKEALKESPADRIAREKAEAEAKAKAEQAAKFEKDVNDSELDAAMKEDDTAVSDEQLDAIEKSDDESLFDPSIAVSEDAQKLNQRRAELANAAAEKLRRIALDYPQSTPGEHTVFGRGGERFYLSDLRALFGLPGPRD